MRIKFDGKGDFNFHTTVRKRADEYFKNKNIGRHANGEMIFKSVLFLGLLFGLYALIISNVLGIYEMLAAAIVLGAVQAFIGFNVSHDAIHGAYSSNKTFNKIMGYSFNLIGANAYMWNITHNQVHHTYTNIPGHDEDLDVAPGMIRLSPKIKLTPMMRFQHIYAFMLYGLTTISWVFRKDYKKFAQDKIGGLDNTNHPTKEYFILYGFKAVYYTLFIVIPLIVLNITWWQFLIGFVLMHLTEGLVLGLVFQLAHVVEGTEYPEANKEGTIEDTWAHHQMRTTANFATKSYLARFLCGGLNFQIEHHLFPQVCHVHYPELSKIVRQVAKEFDYPYHESITFAGALQSHYRTLKKFGQPTEMKKAS